MEASICIEMLFPELPFEERIRRVASYGFRAAEFWSWKDKDLGLIKAAADDCGVAIANFNGHRVGDLIDRGWHGAILRDFRSALAAAEALRCPNLMLLAQTFDERGAVARKVDAEASPRQVAAMAEGVRALLAEPPRGAAVNLALEPLNTRLDHAGYACSSVETAARVVDAVGDPRFGILVDFYHQGVMGDDLVGIARGLAPKIKHVHVADVPGRHEPGTGKVDWAAVLGALRDAGYDGYVGFEFSPSGSSEAAMEALRAFWDRFSAGSRQPN